MGLMFVTDLEMLEKKYELRDRGMDRCVVKQRAKYSL